MSKYFLINGRPGNAQILTIPNEITTQREFDDISDIDIITTKIPKKDKVSNLKLYNEKVLYGSTLVLEYPVKKTKGIIYRPFFDESVDDKSKKKIEKFKRYSFERYERVQAKLRGEDVSLELDRNKKFNDFLYDLLYDSLYVIGDEKGRKSLLDYNSLLPKDLKNQLLEVKEGTLDLGQSLNKISRSLSNYKSLRNFMMEYIHLYGTSYAGLRSEVENNSSERVNGRIYGNEELIRSAITDMDNHQMTLDECMKLTRGRKNG